MAKSFGDVVDDWVTKTEVEMQRILQASVRGLVEEVTRPQSEGGNLPVVTGNLRNSGAVSTAGPVTYNFVTKKFRNSTESVLNATEKIEPGMSVFIGFQAPYAMKVEEKTAFMRLVAQRWPQIVAEAVNAKR
jgi:hypothetical protein